jgi:hypothetical protein
MEFITTKLQCKMLRRLFSSGKPLPKTKNNNNSDSYSRTVQFSKERKVIVKHKLTSSTAFGEFKRNSNAFVKGNNGVIKRQNSHFDTNFDAKRYHNRKIDNAKDINISNNKSIKSEIKPKDAKKIPKQFSLFLNGCSASKELTNQCASFIDSKDLAKLFAEYGNPSFDNGFGNDNQWLINFCSEEYALAALKKLNGTMVEQGRVDLRLVFRTTLVVEGLNSQVNIGKLRSTFSNFGIVYASKVFTINISVLCVRQGDWLCFISFAKRCT